MPLANYASTSAMPNIFSDIEKQLISHGAKQIVRDFGGGKDIPIRLPARFERVEDLKPDHTEKENDV